MNDSADCNFPQLVSNEDGTTIVFTYQASSSSTIFAEPGVVYMREYADTVEKISGVLRHGTSNFYTLYGYWRN